MIADIRPIDVRAARQVRHTVLRPHQEPWQIAFEGDDALDTLHVGAFVEGDLVGVATVMREPLPGEDDADAWRLRGMATLPEVRGQGYGGALLERCLTHIADHGGHAVWCNARVDAAGFYRRYGFVAEGGVFDLPAIGPHVVMRRRLG